MLLVVLTIITSCTLLATMVGIFLVRNSKAQQLLHTAIEQLNSIKSEQSRIESSVKGDLLQNREELAKSSRSLREEVTNNIKSFNDSIILAFDSMSKNHQEQLASFEKQLSEMSAGYLKTQETFKHSVEEKLASLQEDNNKQLEKMRATVDEKLQGTLERRIGESFQQVSQRLEQVHKGLGEMQSLANGVGDLKRVLTNVKTRGTWGEYQLGNILQEMLAPDQFECNVAMKRGSKEQVEYAVKMPGQGDEEGTEIYLPIDSKFPQEDYQRLLQAQEDADPVMEKAAAQSLESAIKKEARKIRDKYINPPKTTNFAVLFLPTEGLYAEVLRRPGLAEVIQREYRVMVAGPTTLAALLNSLSVGFKTLAIQKRSSEIWRLLGAVKGQFGTFSTLLESVQKKLSDASSAMEKANKRSKIIEQKLVKVEQLPNAEAQMMLPEDLEVRE